MTRCNVGDATSVQTIFLVINRYFLFLTADRGVIVSNPPFAKKKCISVSIITRYTVGRRIEISISVLWQRMV